MPRLSYAADTPSWTVVWNPGGTISGTPWPRSSLSPSTADVSLCAVGGETDALQGSGSDGFGSSSLSSLSSLSPLLGESSPAAVSTSAVDCLVVCRCDPPNTNTAAPAAPTARIATSAMTTFFRLGGGGIANRGCDPSLTAAPGAFGGVYGGPGGA